MSRRRGKHRRQPLTGNQESSHARPRKRRRWPYVCLVLMAILAALVLLSPRLLSTKAGNRLVTHIVNGQIKGSLSMESLSLSWAGPTEVKGLRAFDPQGREVLEAPRATYPGGMWRALTAMERLGRIEIDTPQAALYLDEQGRASLVKAFELRQPRPKRPDKPLPELRGTIALSDGSVTIHRVDDKKYEIRNIDVEAELATLAELAGQVSFETTDGGRLKVQFDLSGLTRGNKFRLDGAAGTFSLQTPEPIDLGPLAEFVMDEALAGTLEVTSQGNIEAGKLTAELQTNIAGLQSQDTARKGIQPIDAGLDAAFHATSTSAEGSATVTGPAGKMEMEFSYRHSDQADPLNLDTILSAVICGRCKSLPELTVRAHGEIDMPTVAQAVPTLMNVRPDVKITAGHLLVHNILVKGGARPTLQARTELRALAGVKNGSPFQTRPMSLQADAHIDPNSGLEVSGLALESAFGNAAGRGTTDALTGQFSLDLPKLHEDLGQAFDLGTLPAEGQVSGDFALTRQTPERTVFSGSASALNVRYASGQRHADFRTAQLHYKGHLETAGRRITRIDVVEISASVDDAVEMKARGWYDVANGAFNAEADITRAELSRSLAWIRNLQLTDKDVTRYSGRLKVHAKLARAAMDQPITGSGGAAIRNLQVDGKSIYDRAITLGWTGLELDRKAGRMTLASATLESPHDRLTIESMRWAGGQRTLEGRLGLRSDLARSLAALRPLLPPKLPDIAGQLAWTTTIRKANGRVNLNGAGEILDLRVGPDSGAFKQDTARFTHDAVIGEGTDLVTLRKLDVSSDAFSVKLVGTIDRLRTHRVLDLAGPYEGSWDHITRLLHQLVPKTRGNITIAGRTSGRLIVKGPVRNPQVRPEFHGLDATTRVGWQQASLYGVELGAAEMSPSLRDGQFRLGETAIDALGGKARLAGTVDFTPAIPVYRSPDKLTLLDNLTITREMSQKLLSQINPVFAEMTDIDGKVSLRLSQLVVPLAHAAGGTGGSGGGHMDLTGLNVRPAGMLKDLMRLGGLSTDRNETIRVDGVDFAVRDHRIHYKNFRMVFPNDFDLIFHGSVGLDKTLDLAVSVPIGGKLLEQLGVRGPAADYARVLEGVRIDIPIRGTSDQPMLGMAEVNTRELIDRAMKALLAEQTTNLLNDMLDTEKSVPSRQPTQLPKDEPEPATQPETERPKGQEELSDFLFDLLRDATDKKKTNSRDKR